MNKLKIVIIVGGFLPSRLGGTEVATYHMARHLLKLGHEVHIITSFIPCLDRGLPRESVEDGIYIHRVRVIQERIIGFLSFFIGTLPLIRKINPDVVHAQNMLYALHAWLIKKLWKKPYVMYGRGSDVYLASRFDSLLYRLALKNADAVIAQTNDMKITMNKLCNREIVVIPNGVDLDRFDSLSRAESRHKLNISDKDKILLFVGSLKPVKGTRYLVEAMSIIGQKSNDIRLLVVGDGEERQMLEGLVAKLNLSQRVSFAGQVPNEVVPQYMVAADIFVLPSLSEGFPVTFLEAIASGLPIIATKVRGTPEIVAEGENGFLVSSQDSEKLAERILFLFENRELRERMGRNNREKARRYSWEDIAKKLEQVYTKAINVEKC